MTCDPDTYPFLGYFCIEQKVNISTFIPIFLFFMGFVITKIIEYRNKKAIRTKYLEALRQEIELNIVRLTGNLNTLPSPADIEAFLKQGILKKLLGLKNNKRPIITVTHDNAILNSHIDLLKDLKVELIRWIIEFYGRLDIIKTDASSIEYKAFETISFVGRNALFAKLRRDMGTGIFEGKRARDGISRYLRLRWWHVFLQLFSY